MTLDQALAAELAVARDVAREAGVLSLRYHDTGIEVERKAGDEPVTRADREASELIVARLSREFPGDIVISEEGADDRRRLDPSARVWYVDPIDGTRDFIRGAAGFATMIGLAIGGNPRLGVVYQPIGERSFWSVGDRAWVSDAAGERPLRCAPTADLAEIRLVASKSHRTAKIDDVKNALGIADELNIGSVGLKVALIALGDRDLYVNPSSQSKAWDTCAPEAILAGAGGRLTDLWGDPLRYDDPDMRNRRGLLASNGILHQAVLDRLAPLFPRPT
jgi:3'(2'), 5'-bisphosphate nucleotidase